jgi:hypothetical protein
VSLVSTKLQFFTGTEFDVRLVDSSVFDVNGTLYDQTAVRGGMIWGLLCATLGQPAEGFRTLGVLRPYRVAQEFLRNADYGDENIFET